MFLKLKPIVRGYSGKNRGVNRSVWLKLLKMNSWRLYFNLVEIGSIEV